MKPKMEDPIHNGDHELFFRSIVDNVPTMIFVKDAKDLRFVVFNKAAEKLLGYSRKAMVGKSDYDFFPKPEADFFVGKDRQVLKKKVVLDIPEEPIQTRLLGSRILHTRKIPILDERGNPKYLLGISEDITEKKKAEEELRKIHENLELVVRQRTDALTKANAELRKEIESRSRMEGELKRQNRSLEVLNQAMVGRELKMVELKKELAALKKQLKNA